VLHIDPNDKKPAFRNRIFMEGGASEADISTARAGVHCRTTPSLDTDPRARHKLREILINERTLEAHYGGFVLSQARKGTDEARRLALDVRYGSAGQEGQIVGHAARIYELGPEPAPDDIDGRTPAVVIWHDADLFFLVASDTMSSHELVRIAISLYGRGRIKRAAGGS
jgi:hypothetical protein